MLEVSDIEVRFGGLKALDGLSLEVGEGDRFAHRAQRCRKVDRVQRDYADS